MAEIWEHKRVWPKDWGEFIFLARAICTVGETLSPDWDDTDFTATSIKRFFAPGYSTAERIKITNAAHEALRRSGHEPRRLTDASILRNRIAPLTDDEWEQARHEIDAHNQHIVRSAERREQAERMLLDLLVGGQVRSAIRDHDGGVLTPIDSSWWNGETVGHRFATCKLNPHQRFQLVEKSNDPQSSWIFVNRNDLMSCLFAARTDGTPEKSIQADYLRFAVELDDNPEIKQAVANLEKKEALAYRIQTLWAERFGRELKIGTARAMAILLRDEQSQNGKYDPRRMKSRSA